MVRIHVNILSKYLHIDLGLKSILNLLLIGLKSQCNINGKFYEIYFTVKILIYYLCELEITSIRLSE